MSPSTRKAGSDEWPQDLVNRVRDATSGNVDAAELDLRLREIIDSVGLPYGSLGVPDLPDDFVSALRTTEADAEPGLHRFPEILWVAVWDELVSPTLADAAIRGEWMARNGVGQTERERRAISGGFRWRAFVEDFSVIDLPEVFNEVSDDGQTFAAIFQAGKLRAGFKFAELEEWAGDRRLSENIRVNPVMQAFHLMGTIGTRPATLNDLRRLDQIWHEGDMETRNLLVHALFVAMPFEQQGALLVERAEQYLADSPAPDTVVMYYAARGHRLVGEYERAYQRILDALAGVRARDTSSAVELLQEQYNRERDMIVFKRETNEMRDALADYLSRLDEMDGRIAESQRYVEQRSRETEERIVDLAHGSTVRTTEVVGLFVAAVTFALGSVSLLSGWKGAGLLDRLAVLAAFGLVITAFTSVGIVLIGRQMEGRRGDRRTRSESDMDSSAR